MALKDEVKRMVVERLRLKVAPEDIPDAAPLVGEGLGLDSIDVIELSVAVEKHYGVPIRTEEEGRAAFQSIDSLVRFIEEHRAG